ncbi:MAG: hypothetical protein LPK45_11460 [Bacteroidota bacterium]|nr:hypothetical protein [Bacteroidota bacterium]MDX5431724.1 hypothetical protein [Bacteroidota bacterium]MDX5470439.1 hypothetical protein [Bacteroidota bacterium]
MDKLKAILPQGISVIALLYFFFNTVGLPNGLTYTLLLSPLFLFFQLQNRWIKVYGYGLLIGLTFFLIHFIQGVNLNLYLISSTLLFGAVIFTLATYQFTLQGPAVFNRVMRVLFATNTLLIPIAIAAYFSPWKTSWWYLEPISPGLPIIPRLKMLTYEASYYSLLLVPVVFYFGLKILFIQPHHSLLNGILLLLPLLASFSLGVMGGIAVALFIVYFSHIKWLVIHRNFRRTFILLSGSIVLGLIALIIFYPENPLFLRLANIVEGSDTSSRGRTFESFVLAWKMCQEKSIWFGIGLGQIKELGRDIIIHFYQYVRIPEVVRIPNAAAETLAQFGIVGLSLRLGLQVFLFFRTRVWSNFYRLSLFLFVFIYQFTGSFMVNIAELSIWVLAFSQVAPELDKSNLWQYTHLPVHRWEKEKGGES